MSHKRRDTIAYSPLTFGLIAGIVCSVLAYLYFLNLSVVEVVLRTENVNQQSELRTQIAALEAEYIDAQHTIAARIVTLENYNTDVEKVFLSRTESNLVLLDE